MITPKASMTFTAEITFTEAELKLVAHLSGYSPNDVYAALKKITGDIDPTVLRELMQKVRAQGEPCLDRFKAAREAFHKGRGK